LQKKKLIFYQDNAPAHKSVLTMEILRDLHYKLLGHLPYSPDLAPSDFCLFPILKLFLVGQRFSSNHEAIEAVEGILQILRRTATGTGQWRWSIAGINALVLRGDYVEK
jgi:histone-lysine N-methyltransferase SETMAR